VIDDFTHSFSGGPGESRTRVQSNSGIKSFTGLGSFSKLTKFPLFNPLIHGNKIRAFFYFSDATSLSSNWIDGFEQPPD